MPVEHFGNGIALEYIPLASRVGGGTSVFPEEGNLSQLELYWFSPIYGYLGEERQEQSTHFVWLRFEELIWELVFSCTAAELGL